MVEPLANSLKETYIHENEIEHKIWAIYYKNEKYILDINDLTNLIVKEDGMVDLAIWENDKVKLEIDEKINVYTISYNEKMFKATKHQIAKEGTTTLTSFEDNDEIAIKDQTFIKI